MWKSPFNKIVRSKEALIIGLLTGMVIGGGVGSFLVPTVVKNEVYEDAIKLCDTIDNVEAVTFNFTGSLRRVDCKDSRSFKKDNL